MNYLKNILIIAKIGGRAYSNEISRAEKELKLLIDIAELASVVSNDWDDNYEAMQKLLAEYRKIKS